MQEILKLFIGILVLLVGIPIGNFLAKTAKDELKSGRKWFKLIILICMIGAIIGLIFRDDVLLLSFLFMIVVTERSLKK